MSKDKSEIILGKMIRYAEDSIKYLDEIAYGVQYRIVWGILQNDMPSLINKLKAIQIGRP